jgi:hypothetical protein
MQTLYPERIVAIWFRSGTAFSVWEKGEMARPELSDAVYRVPAMCNPGAKENGDKRFNGAWTGTLAMFKAYRAKGAPIGFAPDPRTGHECGDSRYLAIRFFDACLAQRLPEPGSTKLRAAYEKNAWLAPVLGEAATPASEFKGDVKESVWLPGHVVAKAWSEYVRTGAVGDDTPPPSPTNLKVTKTDAGNDITWDVEADFESGLRGFVIERDGKELATLPEKGVGKFGRALFQVMSYHDTPERPLPALRYVDRSATPGMQHVYRVISVNSVGLRSTPSAP